MELDGGIYGSFLDFAAIVGINFAKTNEEKLELIKQMWEDDPVKYAAWKQWCMEEGELPDVFGTLDDPILIDESKL